MRKPISNKWLAFIIGSSCGIAGTNLAWAKPGLPSAAQALELAPVQLEVDYSKPTAAKIEKCTVEMETAGGLKCYVVRNESGQILRRFADTNGDTKVDTWCYFNDGMEVYRDIDSDGNGKADEYRWLGAAGIRWGLDKDEDSKIDAWKEISAEEVTEEVVAAIRTNDLARFKRVLLTSDESRALKLTGDRASELDRLLTAAVKDFSSLAQKQKVINAKTSWVSFGGGKPGVVPQFGPTQENVIVYDNAAAVVENDGKHAQIAVGTLIRIGNAWRVIDLPRNLLEDSQATALTGFFFQAPLAKADETTGPSEAGISPEMQKLVADLEKIDKELALAKPAQHPKLNATRADLVERISELATGEDRQTWIRQYAETVSAAVQSGSFPEGSKRLRVLTAQLAKQSGQDDLVVFVGFRALQTDYNQSLAAADGKESEIGKIRGAWIGGLEKLVTDFGTSAEAAEPMLALGQECELEGKEEQAVKWYGRISTEFPKSPFADKAKGAKRRLEMLGKTFAISGTTLDGKPFTASALAGKVTVIYYWASWYDRLGEDVNALKAMQTKYGRGLQVVGVNLDSNKEDALKAVKATATPWATLFEPGGFDSRYANDLGVFSLPIVVLLDKQGKVMSRSVNVGELDTELKKMAK